MEITVETLTNLINEEMSEFEGKTVSDVYDNNNWLVLNSIENDIENNHMYLHFEYHRTYFQRTVKKGEAITGWSVKNENDKYLPIITDIEFKRYVRNSNDVFAIFIDTHYNEQNLSDYVLVDMNAGMFITDLDYNDIIADDIRVYCNSDFINANIESSKTVNSLLKDMYALLKIRIKNILIDNFDIEE